jgi:hypothetical protein
MSGKTEKVRRVGATADLGDAKMTRCSHLLLYHGDVKKESIF